MERAINLRDSLRLNIFVLKIFGYWPPMGKRTVLYTLYTLLFLFIFTLIITSETINVIFLTADLEKITDAFLLWLTHLDQIVKVFFFFTKRGSVLDLLDTLDLEIFQPRNKKQRKYIQTMMTSSTRWYYLFFTMTTSTVILWGAFPIIDNLGKELPLSGWYPFATDVSPVYEVIFLYQLVSTLITGLSQISIDCMCSSFMAHVCGQLDCLNDNLIHVREYSVENLKRQNPKQKYDVMTPELQQEMKRLLHRSVKHHTIILKYVLNYILIDD